MLYYRTINAKTLELLKNIQNIDIFKDLRLVGGTSLALQNGHRESIDLDFFGILDADKIEISEALDKIGELKKRQSTKNINIFMVNGIKVDIVNYPYPWLEDVVKEDNLRLASSKDIAAMKLSAITGRGSKKDFIDLYFLLQKYTLKEMLAFYKKKYHDGSVFMVLKSLAYFEDADEEPMPKMFTKVDWKKAKQRIVLELKNNALLGGM